MTDPIFEATVKRLWRSVKGRGAPMAMTRGQFREWLQGASREREGVIWACTYRALVDGCPGLVSGPDLSVDHRVPVALGGASAVDNLAAVCKRCNRLKGSLAHESFEALCRTAAGFTDRERKGLWQRLAQPPGWQRREAAKRRQSLGFLA